MRARVRPDWEPRDSIFFTTSIPSITLPKTTWWPSSQRGRRKTLHHSLNFTPSPEQVDSRFQRNRVLQPGRRRFRSNVVMENDRAQRGKI